MAYELLSQWGDIFALTGSIILWFGIFIFGYIAKKYEQMFNKKTNWWIYIIAPTGILLYAIGQAYYYMKVGKLPTKGSFFGINFNPRFLLYGANFLTSLFVLWCAANFKKIIIHSNNIALCISKK